MKLEINEDVQSPETKPIRGMSKFIESNAEFLEEFKQFVIESGTLGLAANQLKVDDKVCKHRVCAFHIDGEYEVWINPKLLEVKGTPTPNVETCLTHGFDQLVVADRVAGVKIAYNDINGKLQKETFEGDLKCLVVQHVIDHLDGITEFTMPLPDEVDDTVVKASDVIMAPEVADRKVNKNKRKKDRKKKKNRRKKF